MSKGLAFSLQASVGQLGVDFTAGRSRSLATQHGRFAKGAVKAGRWQSLARAGASTASVAQAGIQSSTTWGAPVLGISDSWLHRLRQQVASCVEGARAGRNAALRIALSSAPRADPAFPANARPLVGWCQAIWARLLPHTLLEKAWNGWSASMERRALLGHRSPGLLVRFSPHADDWAGA